MGEFRSDDGGLITLEDTVATMFTDWRWNRFHAKSWLVSSSQGSQRTRNGSPSSVKWIEASERLFTTSLFSPCLAIAAHVIQIPWAQFALRAQSVWTATLVLRCSTALTGGVWLFFFIVSCRIWRAATWQKQSDLSKHSHIQINKLRNTAEPERTRSRDTRFAHNVGVFQATFNLKVVESKLAYRKFPAKFA